jgi:hypothetical protein
MELREGGDVVNKVVYENPTVTFSVVIGNLSELDEYKFKAD